MSGFDHAALRIGFTLLFGHERAGCRAVGVSDGEQRPNGLAFG